jgi:glycosyltransferase involved in cell wall biosynthesis
MVEGGETQEYVVIDPSPASFQGNRIDEKKLPLVSFVIPSLNNERTLEKCLQSICTQKYPYLEIIIVDGGSSDSTIEIAKKFTNKIFFDRGKLGSARQTGIEQASGEIIGSMDSDIYLPTPQWLIDSIKYFNWSDRTAEIWPKCISPPERPLLMRCYWNLSNLILEDRIKKQRSTFSGGNSLLVREFIIQVGGFDRNIHWGEDFHLAMKLKQNGYQVIYVNNPIYHDTDIGLSFRNFVKKQILGAQTFTKDNFESAGLSFKDVLYENFLLGTKGMITGLVREKDVSWLLFPFLLLLRCLTYGIFFLRKI